MVPRRPWSADAIVHRWALAHPRIGRDGGPVARSDAELARAGDAARVAMTRLRLRSLS